MAINATRLTSPPHEFNAAEIGALRRSLSRRNLPQHDLADPPRQHDQLGRRRLGHRRLGRVLQSPKPRPCRWCSLASSSSSFWSSRRGATATSMSGARGRGGWRRTFTPPCCAEKGVTAGGGWPLTLANDYSRAAPPHQLCCAPSDGDCAATYIWILGIPALAYLGKIAIHPVPIASLAELFQRAAVGPIPGEWMLAGGALFNGGWILFALVTLFLDRARRHRDPRSLSVESSRLKSFLAFLGGRTSLNRGSVLRSPLSRPG